MSEATCLRRPGARRRVAFATLGCKTNQFETAAMQERLAAAGYRIIAFDEGAELVVVNTCTVTGATDAQSRNLVRRARRLNPDCRVVVTGCYAQVDPQAFADLPGVSLVIGNEDKRQLLEWLAADTGETRVAVTDISQAETACLPPLTSFNGRSRAFVQIQNGCDAFCSYCIIPYARGRSRSASPGEVLAQIKGLVEAGYPEVVLTGIHIGGYGLDLIPSCSLLDLVSRVEGETGLQRLRLGSLEPTEISSGLIEAMAASTLVCRHLHIPLQSGDDAVLRRMGRPYDQARFRELVLRIHQRLPDAGIGLDVITGFPGETEAEFANTYALIADLPVSYLHVFPFSKRPGTPAAVMPGQVPASISKARAARLRALGEAKQQAFAGKFVGRSLEVVVETAVSGDRLKGITRNYLEVRFAGDPELCGSTAMVEATGLDGGRLLGRLDAKGP